MFIGKVFVKSLICAVACFATVSCASARRHQELGHLGSAYYSASAKLLSATAVVYLDSTSEKLIDNAALSPNQAGSDFDQNFTKDEKLVSVITVLQQHARLLGKYFSLMEQLATTKAPDELKTQVDGTVSNLNTIGNKLRGSDLISDSSLFSVPARAITNAIVRGKLQSELNRNRDAIAKELVTQKVLLEELSKIVESSVSTSAEIRKARLRAALTKNTVSDYDSWLQSRREILLSQGTIGELKSASDAANKLQEAFDALISNKLNSDVFDDILADINSMVTVAEALLNKGH